MLQNWVQSENKSLTPFEITLRAWALYAGDLLGPENSDSLLAYISRLVPDIGAAEVALERIATQMTLSQTPVAHYYAASQWSIGRLEAISEEELEEQTLAEQESEAQGDPETERTKGRANARTLQTLIDAGLVVQRLNKRVSFAQPAVMGYFAARGLVSSGGGELLLEQPAWSGKMNTFHFLASQVDISPIVQRLSSRSDFERSLMTTGRWLRDMPAGSPGRIQIMRRMVGVLQDRAQPIAQRTRAMTALIFSEDKSIPTLCQKLLPHSDPVIRILAALGLGITGDPRAETELAGLLSDSTLEVRTAACLGLAALGTKGAIETVASIMLQADEDTQRSAAEALSINTEEGQSMLLEAAEMDDLLVRRATIYGLEKIDPKISSPVLKNLQLADSQWIVRNVATEVIERIEQGSTRIPNPLPNLDTQPWLIEFAGARGEGLPPGDAAREMLLQVLESGSDEQILAALDYLRRIATPDFFPATINLLDNPQKEVRQAALNTIWHMQSAGLDHDHDLRLESEKPAATQVGMA
jgi:HEAT repeat protein